MYSDPDGNMVITTIFLLVCIGIGAIVGGTYAGVTAYNEGYRGWDLAGKTTAGVLIGGGIGGLVGYVAGPLAASIFGISGSIGLSGGIGAFALASSGTIAGTLVSVSAAGISAAGALVANGLLMLSRPNSGRIRFSDDTGIDPDTGKPVTDKKRAEEIYESLKDSKKRAKWRQWIKGKKWRKSHLR